MHAWTTPRVRCTCRRRSRQVRSALSLSWCNTRTIVAPQSPTVREITSERRRRPGGGGAGGPTTDQMNLEIIVDIDAGKLVSKLPSP
jgi:hypothetical protein